MNQCTRCGASFACGMQDEKPCWCAALPPFMPAPAPGAACHCPRCLNELLAQQQQQQQQ